MSKPDTAQAGATAAAAATPAATAAAAAKDEAPRRILERPINPNREFTVAELARYNGLVSATSPLYMSVRGRVYDVTSADNFYGPPSGGYAMLSGRDASRVLAKMDFTQLESNPQPKWDDFDQNETDTLNDWCVKFDAKYPVVGKLILPTATATATTNSAAAATATATAAAPASNSTPAAAASAL